MARSIACVCIAWVAFGAMGSVHAAEANPCTTGTNAQRCRIDVAVTDDPSDATKCKISIPVADQNELQLGSRQPTRLIWRINGGDNSYNFCRYTGDGVFLKHPTRLADQQVLRFRVMEDKDKDGPQYDANFEHGCHSRFKWTFENTSSRDFPIGTKYEYIIRVRSADFKRTCELDPWVKNGGSSLVR